jgi:hypothetical protein
MLSPEPLVVWNIEFEGLLKEKTSTKDMYPVAPKPMSDYW